ncbi:DUF6875 domain-containing protein [Cupriavidus pauculus]|uniref:DUF6875 domain-containing protein n=1 Tax=Cupriavidus pauculus TaxID=82633 RepID=UPI001D0C5716|nr:hypothetical protein [Cupriavidus pauculus]
MQSAISTIEFELIPFSRAMDDDRFASAGVGTIAKWVMEYLCRPHPELGRKGVVCPWTPVAIAQDTLWITRIDVAGLTDQAVDNAIEALLGIYRDQIPTDGDEARHKTILTIIDGLDRPADVAEIHKRMKPVFVAQGLMLGEFYEGCEKPGIRNANFHALQSPLPLLVIREMVALDAVFLSEKRAFLDDYFTRHGEHGLNKMNAMLRPGSRLDIPPHCAEAMKAYLAERAHSVDHLDAHAP